MAALTGADQPEFGESPDTLAGLKQALSGSRVALLRPLDAVDEDSFHALRPLGHKEYSVMSGELSAAAEIRPAKVRRPRNSRHSRRCKPKPVPSPGRRAGQTLSKLLCPPSAPYQRRRGSTAPAPGGEPGFAPHPCLARRIAHSRRRPRLRRERCRPQALRSAGLWEAILGSTRRAADPDRPGPPPDERQARRGNNRFRLGYPVADEPGPASRQRPWDGHDRASRPGPTLARGSRSRD
jgi:hypothetical protein